MSEKPGKRLVSKGRYVRTLMGKSALYSLSAFMLLAGLLLLAIVLFLLADIRRFFSDMPLLISIAFIPFLIWITFAAINFSRNFYKEAKAIEPVRPLTLDNERQLSPGEFLVRASDLPPSGQQAELLRAAKSGQATPPDEMLRATTGAEGADDE